MLFMRKFPKVVACITMLCVLTGTFAFSSYADDLSDAEQERNNLEERKREVEEEIAALEAEKEDVIEYIEKLDTKLNEITAEVDALNTRVEEATTELENTRQELANAKNDEENQYVTMKKRIQYMYENGNTDYVEILLHADSITELLNRTEYISKISEYDNNLFQRYKESKNLVIKKEEQVENKLEKLNILKEELKTEQDAIATLLSNKEVELTKYDQTIVESEKMATEYAKAITEQEEKIDKMIEEERRKAEENGYETFGNVLSNGYIWPLTVKGRITSTFGRRKAPTKGASTYHKGLDIAAPMGTSILASADGRVTTASYQSAAGNFVMISHGNGMYTAYMHASKLNVKVGEQVKQGDVIAYVGSTGVSTGPHLHFGVIKDGKYVDPQLYVSTK